jgi:hypothetical protein
MVEALKLLFLHFILMDNGTCGMKGGCKGKGIVALVLGVLFLLGTLGVWPEFTLATYWPLFLIFWGLHKTFCPCHGGGACGSKGGCPCGGNGACCKK